MKANEKQHRYDDIINLPHHQSAVRPHMAVSDRAAQFSSFAALSGYEDAISEAARLTDKKIELDEYSKDELNARLNVIQDTLDERPEVVITHFLPDQKKAGGAYVTATGRVKKIDEYEKVIVMENGKKIRIEDIAGIGGMIFDTLEDI